MAYWKDVWKFTNSTEYEYKYAGRYGARGEKRAPKQKATKEQIQKQNQRNREKNMRRLIKANFSPGDLWCTLKYPKGTRKPVAEVKKDLKNFLNRMRREYKARGEKFKFIYRLEIGKQGGIHIHILINRSAGKPDTDMLLQNIWNHGQVYYATIREEGGYKNLAEYIVKMPDEEVEKQLSSIKKEERKEYIKFSSSRNLIRPRPERHYYSRRTMKQIVDQLDNGTLQPTEGYYIDKESVYCGVNPYTGMTYLQYTEYALEKPPGKKGGRLCKKQIST